MQVLVLVLTKSLAYITDGHLHYIGTNMSEYCRSVTGGRGRLCPRARGSCQEGEGSYDLHSFLRATAVSAGTAESAY